MAKNEFTLSNQQHPRSGQICTILYYDAKSTQKPYYPPSSSLSITQACQRRTETEAQTEVCAQLSVPRQQCGEYDVRNYWYHFFLLVSMSLFFYYAVTCILPQSLPHNKMCWVTYRASHGGIERGFFSVFHITYPENVQTNRAGHQMQFNKGENVKKHQSYLQLTIRPVMQVRFDYIFARQFGGGV